MVSLVKDKNSVWRGSGGVLRGNGEAEILYGAEFRKKAMLDFNQVI